MRPRLDDHDRAIDLRKEDGPRTLPNVATYYCDACNGSGVFRASSPIGRRWVETCMTCGGTGEVRL